MSELYHVGNENSGRYPRGSGERPYQHGGSGIPRSLKRMSKRKLKKMSVTELQELVRAQQEAGKQIELRREYERNAKRLRNNKPLSSTKKKTKDDPIKSLSDDELRKRTTRLELERNYKQLMSQTVPKKHATVKKILARVDAPGTIGDLGKQIFSATATDILNNHILSDKGITVTDPVAKNKDKKNTAKINRN